MSKNVPSKARAVVPSKAAALPSPPLGMDLLKRQADALKELFPAANAVAYDEKNVGKLRNVGLAKSHETPDTFNREPELLATRWRDSQRSVLFSFMKSHVSAFPIRSSGNPFDSQAIELVERVRRHASDIRSLESGAISGLSGDISSIIEPTFSEQLITRTLHLVDQRDVPAAVALSSSYTPRYFMTLNPEMELVDRLLQGRKSLSPAASDPNKHAEQINMAMLVTLMEAHANRIDPREAVGMLKMRAKHITADQISPYDANLYADPKSSTNHHRLSDRVRDLVKASEGAALEIRNNRDRIKDVCETLRAAGVGNEIAQCTVPTKGPAAKAGKAMTTPAH